METTESKTKKIIKIVINVIFYALIVVLLLFSIANLNAKDEFEIPNLFGNGFTTVGSNSMEGNEKDSFTTNDLLFVRVVNDKNREKKLANLEVGDIITFKYWSDTQTAFILNTHRIVDIKQNETGETYYITQGDRVAMNDDYDYKPGQEDNDMTKCEVVAAKDIRGIYKSKWEGAGKFFKFISSSNGFLLCIVLPVAIFFIVELVLLALQFVKIKQERNEVKHAEELEELKRKQAEELEKEKARIRAEILAEQENKDKE